MRPQDEGLNDLKAINSFIFFKKMGNDQEEKIAFMRSSILHFFLRLQTLDRFLSVSDSSFLYCWRGLYARTHVPANKKRMNRP